jgi:LmbE family N-acetylglucosaminyl deacetylase
MRRVIVIAAHPDDETLGCGGLLLKERERGSSLAWVIATKLHLGPFTTQERIDSRLEEIERVRAAYTFAEVFQFDFEPSALDAVPLAAIIERVSAAFKAFNPELVLIPHRSDAHSDHRVLFAAVMACTKVFRYPSVRQIMSYECLSETEFGGAAFEGAFVPNYYLDITKHLREKQDIMSIYASELGEHPFPRSLRNIEALSVFRGAAAGVEYAEAFQLLKIIDK